MNGDEMTTREIIKCLRNTCEGCNPTPCCEFEVLGDLAANLIESLLSRAEAAEAALKEREKH